MALFVTDPLNSLQDMERIVDRFQAISGLCVNKDKSTIYPMNVDSLS